MKKLFKTLCILSGLFSSLIYAQIQDSADIQLSTGVYDHVENAIAINPTNPNNILVGTIGENVSFGNYDMPYYYSYDGGKSWSGNENLPYNITFGGDPAVFFDFSGNAYYVAIGTDYKKMYVAKSTDGGKNWITPIVNANPQMDSVDNPDAKADLSGINPNYIYVVWSGRSTIDRIRFSRSTDGGTSFQSTPTDLESTSNTQPVRGSNISIGPNGEVYVFWAIGDNPENAIRFCKSTDFGNNFTPAVNAFSISGINNGNKGNTSYYSTRVNSWPSSDVDRTNGSRHGWIYVVYAEKCSTGDSDIHLIRSTDGGSSWNGPYLVNQTAADKKEQWFPSLSVDQVSGDLFVSYYGMDSTGSVVGRFMAVSTDGGNTFTNIRTSDSWFTPTGTSYNSIFMGDYFKTIAYGYNGFACWSDNTSGHYQVLISKVSLHFTATVDQKLSGGITTVGTVKRWQSTSFNAFPSLPAHPTFTVGINEILQGDQNIYSGQKYYQWNTDPDVTNHHVFIIDGNTNRFVSNFNPTFTGVTIQNRFLDDPSYSLSGNTNVGFADPWYIDYADPNYGSTTRNRGMKQTGTDALQFRQRLSPFQIDSSTVYNNGSDSSHSYEGIFLNQDYNTKPFYYSVSFPSNQSITVNGNSHELYFYNWIVNSGATVQSATANPTPVVFTSSSGVVTANVKGHLLSGITSATSSNRERALVQDAYGVYHLVYQSAGDIWYTRSTDNGATWSAEIMLSAGNGTAHNPSITDQGNYSNNIFVLWVDNSTPPVTGYSVYARKLFPSSGQWEPIEMISGYDGVNYSGYAKQNSKPVGVTYSYNSTMYCLVAYENTESNVVQLLFGTIDPNQNNDSWAAASIPGVSSSSENPSMFYDQNQNKIYVAYDNTNDIYMSYWDKQANPSSPSFSSPYLVSNSSVASPNTNPTVTSDGSGLVHFAWMAYDHSTYYINAIYTRSLSWQGFNWSPLTEFAYYYPFDSPTICGHSDANGGASLLFHSSNNYVYKVASTDGVNWNGGPGNPGITIGSNSYTPSALSYANPASVTYVWTTGSAAPYEVPFQIYNENTNTIGKISALTSVDSTHKKVFFNFSQSYLFTDKSSSKKYFMNIDNLNITNSNNQQVMLYSSPSDKSSLTLEEYGLPGAAISAGNYTLNGNLKYWGSTAGTNIKIVLSDSSSNLSLPIAAFNAGSSTKPDSLSFSLPVVISGGLKNLKLNLLVNGIADSSLTPMLINTYFLMDSSGAILKKRSGNLASINAATYSLSQNYPNPFNPTTIINYQIPNNNYVTLKVYDVLGNLVKTLVDGYKTQGSYSINFNADNLASGIYFYQLKAGSFTATKKFLFLK